jgi:two-component system, chemotaxis family, protein-glutamate methylesterase/glutaminase
LIPIFLTHSPAQVARQLLDALAQDVRFRLLGASCQPDTLTQDLQALVPTTPSLAVVVGGCGDASARLIVPELLRFGVSRVVVLLLPSDQDQSRDLERKLLNQGAMHVEWAQLNDQACLDPHHLRRLLRLIASLSYVRVVQTTSRTGMPALRIQPTQQTTSHRLGEPMRPSDERSPPPRASAQGDAPTPVAPVSTTSAGHRTTSRRPGNAPSNSTDPTPAAPVSLFRAFDAKADPKAGTKPRVARPATLSYEQASALGRSLPPDAAPAGRARGADSGLISFDQRSRAKSDLAGDLTGRARGSDSGLIQTDAHSRARGDLTGRARGSDSGLIQTDAHSRAKGDLTGRARGSDSGLISFDERSRAKSDLAGDLTGSARGSDSGLIPFDARSRAKSDLAGDPSGHARGSDSGMISFDEHSATKSASFSRDHSSGLHSLSAARAPEPSFTSDPLSSMARASAHHAFDLIGIGSSTGGLTALENILSRLPHDFPVPLCIAQHIGKGFDQDFVKTLQRATPLDVRLLHRASPLTKGVIYVCPSGVHVVASPGPTLTLTEHPASLLYRPSVSVFFHSMAETLGTRCIGVLLTGMGQDGADGLLNIRQRGGRTVVQNRETCLVFGMPRAAIQLGAAEQTLPVNDIGPELTRLVKAPPPLTRR